MSYEELIRYVREPETISANAQTIIFEFKKKYPYFSLAQWLYLKSLQVSDSIYFDKEKNKTSLYASDRRKLYYFIYPENKEESIAVLRNRTDFCSVRYQSAIRKGFAMKIKFYGITADPDTAQDGWFPGGGGPITSDKRPKP